MSRKELASKPGHYKVIYERDESGAWLARVPSVRGCHTYGRTLDQARRRIREALSLWVDDADKAEFDEEVRLPTHVRRAINASRVRRREADAKRAAAQEATARAARRLIDDCHIGLRDAAELLGLSHQRVQQLLQQ
jgi:predicted RNase H-like HicB family nuclease